MERGTWVAGTALPAEQLIPEQKRRGSKQMVPMSSQSRCPRGACPPDPVAEGYMTISHGKPGRKQTQVPTRLMSSAWDLRGLCAPDGSPSLDLGDSGGGNEDALERKGQTKGPLCAHFLFSRGQWRAARWPSHCISPLPRAQCLPHTPAPGLMAL